MKKRGARLGQHFLKAKWVARSLAYAVGISNGDTVLEIGPGKGALTRELLALAKETGARVVAIEKDVVLVVHLNEIFHDEIDSGLLTVHNEDIRDADPKTLGLTSGTYVAAANIPYYITGEIIRQFLTAEEQPRAMALLVQKEVAQRIVSKKESLLSLSVKAFGTPKIVMKVPRGNFSPPPSVDSAILVIKNISRDFFSDIDEDAFFEIVRAGFSSKRKFLARNLAKKFGPAARDALILCGIPEKSRAEDVTLEKWKCLIRELTENSQQ